jgi:hypothetical protein
MVTVKKTASIVCLVVTVAASEAFSQNQVEVLRGKLRDLPPSVVSPATLARWIPERVLLRPQSIPSKESLAGLVAATIDSSQVLTSDPDFYCVIHVVLWDDAMLRQAWYLFRGGKSSWKPRDVTGQRLYGATRIGVLYIYINPPTDAPVTYKVAITKRRSTPVQNLARLIELGTEGNPEGITTPTTPTDTAVKWGGGAFATRYPTSEIRVDGFREMGEGPLDSIASQSFYNEGLTRWDVSVAVPVNSVKEISYASDGNVVTAKTITRQKIYAVVDMFPPPFKPVDPRSNRFQYIPVLFGVSLADKPFNHLLVATGFRVQVFSGFVGLALNNDQQPRTLRGGDSATPSKLANEQKLVHYVPKLVVGLNLSVARVLATLSGN